MIETRELPGSRIEVKYEGKTYQVDTLGQNNPHSYAINKVKNASR